MAAYEFWNEYLRAQHLPGASRSYEGFRDRMLQLMPGYYNDSAAGRKARRARALELYNSFTRDDLIDFYRGALRPEV